MQKKLETFDEEDWHNLFNNKKLISHLENLFFSSTNDLSIDSGWILNNLLCNIEEKDKNNLRHLYSEKIL